MSVVERFSNKNILITGSNGFLGKNFINKFYDYLEKNNINLYLIDNNIISNNQIYNNKNIHYKQGSVNDLNKNVFDVKFDYIINLSGIASPHWYNKLQVETLDINLDGTRNVLKLAKEYDSEVLLFSSSEVYGTPPDEEVPTNEDYIGKVPTLTKRSAYDVGKLVTETLGYIYSNLGVKVKICRPFNFVGKGLSSNDGRVLPNLISKVLKNENLIIYGDGNQTRTFCHVEDAIEGCLLVLLDGVSGEAYNVGNSNNEISMYDFALKIIELTKSSSKIQLVARPLHYATEPLRRCPDISKVKKLKYCPTKDLDYIITEFYEWAKVNYE